MLSTLIRHEQALFMQTQQSAACMSSHPVEARLCRWLLRARDLAGSDTLDFTQEFLAEMLGAQRTSVTLSAQTLQETGLIEYKRGKIRILDVGGPDGNLFSGMGTRVLRASGTGNPDRINNR